MLTTQQQQQLKQSGFGPAQIKAYEIAKFGRTSTQQQGQSFFRDLVGDVADTARGVVGAISGGFKEAAQDFQVEGRSPIKKGFDIAGSIAGGAAEAVGEVALGAGKAVLPQSTEDVIGEKVQQGTERIFETQPVQDALKWYSSLPEDKQRDINTAAELGSVLLEVVGLRGSKVLSPTLTNITSGVKNVNIPKPKLKNITNRYNKIVKPVKDLGEDIIPTAAGLRDRTLARSLRLAPVEDIARIENMTGNDIGDFMFRNQLIKDTPGETVEAISNFKRSNFDLTRDAIDVIPEQFNIQDLPEMKPLIDTLRADLQGRNSAPYRQALERLNTISKKEAFDLSDAQYVKELFDDIESVYTRTGAVRDAVKAQDSAQLVEPLRRFIEDRVQEVYPQIDIRQLNNNVQTARAIQDAVIKRSGKADTESFFQLGDLSVLGFGSMQSPTLGFGALFGKKVIESAPVQLRLARFFADRAKNKAKKMGTYKKGLTPEQVKEFERVIQGELGEAIDMR